MKTRQIQIKGISEISEKASALLQINPQLILVFGGHHFFEDKKTLPLELSKNFPNCIIMGCSTAGEISNKGVFNDSLIITACYFNKTKLATTESQISSMADSYQCGQNLGQKLISHNAKTVFMLGRGIDINGSSLIEGTRKILGPHTILTGGLAGDAGNFKTTYTLLNGQIHTDRVIALALSGESLEVGFGSQGGWEAFGPVRVVTKSIQNVLYELDGQPALQLYKKYLGDKAKDLPASGLLYPFQLLNESNDAVGLVRTILAVDEVTQSVTLAGDIPMNGRVRLMHTSNEDLIEGAKDAASLARLKNNEKMGHQKPIEESEQLAILVSCVGRKLVMGDDIEDEIDAVKEILPGTTISGFYSYGEICPINQDQETKLHNQTMTITVFKESA